MNSLSKLCEILIFQTHLAEFLIFSMLLQAQNSCFYDNRQRKIVSAYNENQSASECIKSKENEVLNYLINRSTDASAESLNSQMMGFKTQLHGIADIPFFMYSKCTIFGWSCFRFPRKFSSTIWHQSSTCFSACTSTTLRNGCDDSSRYWKNF